MMKTADGRRQTAVDQEPTTNDQEPFTRRNLVSFAPQIVCALLLLLWLPAVASAQGTSVPPPQQSQQPQPPSPQKRRALEIRGQAPAPEVVTVRPREVPQFQRKIITPILYDAAPSAPTIAYYIVLPGPLPEPRSAAQSNPVPKPF